MVIAVKSYHYYLYHKSLHLSYETELENSVSVATVEIVLYLLVRFKMKLAYKSTSKLRLQHLANAALTSQSISRVKSIT